MCKKRMAEDRFKVINNIFPVVLVTGARQIGKTTMLKHLSQNENRAYVTLDDLNIRDMAINDPKLFFQNFPPPVIISEIQYAPNLFEQIKSLCEKDNSSGQYWLTGSQSYELIEDVAETLAGRVGLLESATKIIEVMDIVKIKEKMKTAHEFNIDDMWKFIFFGGMPKTFSLTPEEHREYMNSYIRTYLMRDVMELGKITDTVKFNRFLVGAAAMIAKQLNIATLARVADITEPTAKEWLKLLQGLGIVYLIQPYNDSEIKRLVKAPKLYFYDTGIAAYLSMWPTADTLKISSVNGDYFENFVMNQIVKKLSYSENQLNIFYYRDNDQKEIDIVIEKYDGLLPMEIKLTSSAHYSDVKKFSLLKKFKKPVLPGALICTIDEPLLAQEGDIILPIKLI